MRLGNRASAWAGTGGWRNGMELIVSDPAVSLPVGRASRSCLERVIGEGTVER